MSSILDPYLIELESKIQILERENEVLSAKAEENLLLNRAFEEINVFDDIDNLLLNTLESISILLNIPFSGLFDLNDNCFKCISSYALFSNEDTLNIEFSVSEINLRKITSKETCLLQNINNSFIFKYSTTDFIAHDALIIGLDSEIIKGRYFVFINDKDGIDLAGRIPVFIKVIRIISARLERIYYQNELEKLNDELEQKIEIRTIELFNQNQEYLILNEEHKKTNEELRIAKEKAEESELIFRKLFEASSDAILLINKAGVFVEFNQAALDLLKMTRDQLQFKPPEGISPVFQHDGRKSKESSVEMIDLAKQKGLHRFDWTHVNAEGGEFIVEVALMPIVIKGETLLHTIWRDITEKKKAEEKLKLLNRAVEASSVSVVITDAVGSINYVNPFFTELTGYSYEEALGKNPRFLKSGNQSKKIYRDLWDTILSCKDWTGEFQNKKKNGELYWENAVISPILNSNGKVTHFVAIKEDVTERKRTMEELGAAKEKAEESDRLKTAFLHNISHEIRTPMNAIIGFSALLSEPGIDEGSRTFYTKTITQSSDQLLSIINDIVDISNIEAGIVNISKEEIRINKSLDRLLDQFSLKAKEKGIVLRKVAPLPDEEAIIFADNTRFIQVISNLLNNAFKFTNEGTVEFGYKPGKDFIEFYVSDTGIGIPGDQLTRIFERFYQVDLKMARLNEGTGLGLAISKSFIDLMGGKIWAESDPGKGSTIFLTLPFYKSREGKEIGITEKQKYIFDREYSILVAEDDRLNSHLINSFLSIPDLKVTIVGNGAEAVDHCRSGNKVDLVLMDLKMPVMDGFEATRLIKEFRPDLPVIAQTAYASEDDKKRALSSGCNDFITKPFIKEALISKIRENL